MFQQEEVPPYNCYKVSNFQVLRTYHKKKNSRSDNE